MVKLVLLVLLSSLAAARSCQDMTIPISITATNAVFDLAPPRTEIDVTNFFLRFTRQGSNYTNELLKGYEEVSGTYSIAATLCHPASGPGHALQILTHGIGFSRLYWDLPPPYSYVDLALSQNFSTFSYDRIGVGHSSKPTDSVNEIQQALQTSALSALLALLTNTPLSGFANPPKTVLVGHSFGSVLTYNLLHTLKPTMAILTGFSHVPAFMARFALGGNFRPTPSQEGGYLLPQSSIGMHTNFFAPDSFSPHMLSLAASTSQPASPGELLTLSQGTHRPSPYDGPVMLLTGRYDLPFCGGDCAVAASLAPGRQNLLDVSRDYFPHASVFNASIVQDAGHALNMGFSMSAAFDLANDFILKNL